MYVLCMYICFEALEMAKSREDSLKRAALEVELGNRLSSTTRSLRIIDEDESREDVLVRYTKMNDNK